MVTRSGAAGKLFGDPCLGSLVVGQLEKLWQRVVAAGATTELAALHTGALVVVVDLVVAAGERVRLVSLEAAPGVVQAWAPTCEPRGLDAIKHRLPNYVRYQVDRSVGDAAAELILAAVAVVPFLETLVVGVISST